jgi:carbonic anhydrase/acetyltransferase-like protein (isoleucine patch superfamily)
VIEAFQGKHPSIGTDVFVADTARVIGDVDLGDCASVWHGAVIRGDVWRIRIGAYTNIQDLCVCHVTTGGPELVIGERVTVGHRAILHSCTIGDGCLIGMGCVILDGVKVGGGSIVAAGSVLLTGLDVPPRSLVAGVPAAVKRTIDPAASERLVRNAEEYHALALAYLGKRPFAPPEGRT